MEAHPIDEQGLPLIFYLRYDGETVAVLQKATITIQTGKLARLCQ